VTYGPPEPREAAWAKQLERLLNRYAPADAPGFEVFNLGVTGYNIEQVVEPLVVSGLPHDPDLILYGYVLNDPQELNVEGTALEDLRDTEERCFRDDMTRGLSRMLSRSRLFLLARHALYTPTEPPQVRFRQLVDPGYLAFRAGDVRGRYLRNLHLAAEPFLFDPSVASPHKRTQRHSVRSSSSASQLALPRLASRAGSPHVGKEMCGLILLSFFAQTMPENARNRAPAAPIMGGQVIP
jgi:hypothetical protein